MKQNLQMYWLRMGYGHISSEVFDTIKIHVQGAQIQKDQSHQLHDYQWSTDEGQVLQDAMQLHRSV